VSWNFLPARNENVEREESEEFLSSHLVDKLCKKSGNVASVQPAPDTISDTMDFPQIDVSQNEPSLYDKNYMTREKKSYEGGREYVAGFISDKLKDEFPDLAMESSEKCTANSLWIRHLSRGGLTEPSKLWFHTFRLFDDYFLTFHSPSIKVNKEPGVVRRLCALIQHDFPEVDEKIVKIFAMSRTKIRVDSINKEIEAEKIRIRNLRRQSYMDGLAEPEEALEPVEDMFAEELPFSVDDLLL